jgi:hypothetical protein
MVTSSKKDFAGFPERVRSGMDDAGPVYELSRDASDSENRPVYVLGSGGRIARPTGLVFVRFKIGVTPDDRARDIEDAGYEIEQTLDYAPEAAWVRAKTGDIADALHGISHLEKISDVENVEPQMLMRRSSRQD